MELNWWFVVVVLCVEGVVVSSQKKAGGGSVNHQSISPPDVRKSYPDEYMSKRNATAEQATFRKFVANRHYQRMGMLSDLKQQTYSKQYKMFESVFPPIFETVQEQRVLLESSGYIPGGDWPMNMTIRDAMTHVVEGALFFGEAFIRMPDVTRRIIRANKEWELLIGWAWTFSSECLVYLDEKMHAPIIIMGQELGFIDKDPEFLKLYREKLDKVEIKKKPASDVDKLFEEAKQHMKDKKKSERGPKMSRTSGDL